MPALMIAVNVFFAVVVVCAEAANIFLGIATQHRFHGVESAGPLLRRHVWSRHARPHAGSVRPVIARREELGSAG